MSKLKKKIENETSIDVEEEPKEVVIKPINEETVSNEDTVFIYCGPSTSRIARYTSYKEKLPDYLNDDFKNCKMLKNMFVTLKEFTNFEDEVVIEGSIENLMFKEVNNYFNKGDK